VSRNALRIALGVGAVIFLFIVWFALQVFPLGGPGRLVVFTVAPGDSVSAVAGELHAKGVISSSFAFEIDASFFGPRSVQAGSYQIAQNSSFSHVRAVLNAGPNVDVIAVTPGLTVHEISLTLASDRDPQFAAHFRDDLARLAAASAYHPDLHPPSLPGQGASVSPFEGLVGVGRYLLTPGETASRLAARMSRGFSAEAASVGFSAATTRNGLSAYQLLVAASIVEREGYYPQNMPQVARVIYNRLRRGGPLQMDSTVKYAFGVDAGAVTEAMLQTATPYNTYLHVGLTPTPICAVSTTALRAVLHAPPGNWLYFVLIDQKGDEAFASTYQQQLANEKVAASRGLG
jgi:peptidoglycan lytic transglycosylase G